MSNITFRTKDFPLQEKILKKRLVGICKEELDAEICKAIQARNQKKIVDICLKTLSLPHLQRMTGAKNILETARNEACFLPKPLSQSNISRVLPALPSIGLFNKIVQYSVQVITHAFLIDLDAPPTNSWSAQGQLNLFLSSAMGGKWVWEKLFAFFGTVQKTAFAASGILASLVVIRILYSRFHVGTPEVISKDRMTNLSRKAQGGFLKKTTGRVAEMQQLVTALTPSPIEKPKIAFLVGPPGAGKTQLVEGLAIRIHEKMVPALQGKRLFSVNTADLVEMGNFNEQGYKSRLDLVLKAIEGHERNVILFFDEAHNAASSSVNGDSSGTGLLIEQLKTKFLERGVFAILATTQEEYDEFIVPHKAFVERTEVIQIPSLGNAETALILQEAIQNEDVKVTQDAIDETIKIGHASGILKERANPRKSFDILQKGVKHVISWAPASLQKKLEAKEIECSVLKTECCAHSEQTPHFVSSIEGQRSLSRLRAMEQEIKALKTSLRTQTTALEEISHLRSLESAYFKKHCEIAHLFADPNNKKLGETEKNYLFFTQILLPCVRKELARKVAAFEGEFQEKIPLQVDAKILQELYMSV